MIKHPVALALIAALIWAASSATVQADPIHIDVSFSPAHIEEYPRTVYLGRPVYLVDGRWYYRHGPRWAYYREEPRPLIEYRMRAPRHYYRERPRHYEYREAPRHVHHRRHEHREHREHRHR